MRYFNRLLLSLLSTCFTIFMLIGCTAESEEEPSPPDDVTPTEEESQAQAELDELQARYDDLLTDYADVQSQLEAKEAEYDVLSSTHNELDTKYNELDARYSSLSTKYDELNVEYAELTKEPEPIDIKVLEQTILDLINQERVNNRLPEIEWTEGLYWYATEHSQSMARQKQLIYSGYSYWQDIFRAAGYRTVDDIAKAAMIVWKDSYQFETNFLDKDAKYGAVGVAKSESGEVYYITFFAHIW